MSTRPREKRRRRVWPWLAGIVLALVLLAVGVALGRALQDNPKPDLTVTTTRTIVP